MSFIGWTTTPCDLINTLRVGAERNQGRPDFIHLRLNRGVIDGDSLDAVAGRRSALFRARQTVVP